jgi:hypothetical protein
MDPNIFRTRAGCVVISSKFNGTPACTFTAIHFTGYHIDITNTLGRPSNVRHQVVIKIVIAFPANPSYLITHGYIRQNSTRSDLNSPTNRRSGKTPLLNSGRRSCEANTSHRRPLLFARDASEACGSCQSSLGTTKGCNNSCCYKEKKGPAHAGWAKKALPVNESSLGSKKESGGSEETSCEEKGHTHPSRAEKAL